MRGTLPPPFTESAYEGVRLDAHICSNLCKKCGTPNFVQGCACIRGRRCTGNFRKKNINITEQGELPRRKSCYHPKPSTDAVLRRSKGLATRQARRRTFREATTDKRSNFAVTRAMGRTKSKLPPDPQQILDDMNGVEPKKQDSHNAAENLAAGVLASLH